MDKVLDLPTRRWYREQTLANGWSRNALSLQIDAHAHARHSKAISDFAAVLPAPQSELARQSLKDPYIFDVKKGEFKPEYAGKLNSYCNVVNDRLRQPTDAPTTGLILCQTRGRLSAEYSVTGIDKPIGISTYELTRALPVQLRSALPTVEEIEAELAPRPPDPTASAASRRS